MPDPFLNQVHQSARHARDFHQHPSKKEERDCDKQETAYSRFKGCRSGHKRRTVCDKQERHPAQSQDERDWHPACKANDAEQ